MRLYVANTTKQDHDFVYRVPEIERLFQQPVPSGGQILVYKDDSSPVINAIIKQHERYGLVNIAEIDRRKPFIGLCYSVDKEIPVSKIMYAAEHNDDVLAADGLQHRKESAAALSENINRSTSGSLRGLEVQVVEAKRPGDTTQGFDSTIEVPQTGEKPRNKGGRPRKAT